MPNITNQDQFSNQNEKEKSGSWLLFFILFILVLCFVIYYFSEIKQELKLLDKVNAFWLIAAIFAQFLTYFFTAIIYFFLLDAQRWHQSPSLWDLLKASFISLFINQTVPSAGISGNIFIFNFLVKFDISVTRIISLILTELLTSYAAIEVLIIFFLATYRSDDKEFNVFTVTLVAGFAAYILFGILVGLAGKKRSLEFFYKKIKKIKFIKEVFEKYNQRIVQEGISNKNVHLLNFLKKNKRSVLKACLFHLLVVGADGATLYALFLGLGTPVSTYVILLSLVSTRIISLMPFLPGSLFLYESSMSFFFASLGVPLNIAIIVTLVFRLLSFWFPMPIGLLLYRRWLSKGS